MADPTPDQIRQALDVLGINPDVIRRADENEAYVCTLLDALSDAARALSDPPVPVSRDTPAGTEIADRPGIQMWFLARRRNRADEFWFEDDDGNVFMGNYSEGWVEVRRPDPSPPTPVEVGQTRLMPVKVACTYEDGDVAVEVPDADQTWVTLYGPVVASWTLQEET